MKKKQKNKTINLNIQSTMKTLFTIICLLGLTVTSHSQISYIRVMPMTQVVLSGENFDNATGFKFFLNTMESIQSKQCKFTGYVSDPTLTHSILAITGNDMEYVEAATDADTQGYFSFTISSDNLPELWVVVYYQGEQTEICLDNVNITFIGDKYDFR